MMISEKRARKVRIVIQIDPEVLRFMQELAEKEERSVSNTIVTYAVRGASK